MKAVLIGAGGRLELAEIDAPRPGPTDVVLAVRAAGVNRADLAHREGRHDPGAPEVRWSPGWMPPASSWRPGRRSAASRSARA